MASSWITTPHLRLPSDTTSSESHPDVLAHDRAGPFAISAAQISVKIGEDGHLSLPSDVIIDKRFTHNAPAVVALQVKDGPQVPSDVFTASPLLKLRQVSRSQSPSSSSTFEQQVFASIPTTNSQPVAPISAASNVTPPLPSSPDDARPTSITDISTAGSPTVAFSQLPTLNQSLPQSSYPEYKQSARPAAKGPGESRSSGTSGGDIETDYFKMLSEPIPFRFNVMTCVCLWIVLAGFLVLPSSFPTIQTLVDEAQSNKLNKVVRFARNIPLLVIGFACSGVGAIGLSYLWWRFRHNYVWLLSSIFIPATFNGLSGLISIFVNLYGSNDNGVHYGTTTIATIAATGGCAAVGGFLTIIYTIRKHIVKRLHDRHIAQVRSEYGDGIKEKLSS